MDPYIHGNIVDSNQDTEITWVAINRWMDKDVVYIHNEILLSCKKEWKFSVCNNLDGPGGYHDEQSKSEKINTVCFHLYVKPKKIN